MLRVTGFDTPVPAVQAARRTTCPTSTGCLTPSTARWPGECAVRREFTLPDVGEGLTEAEILSGSSPWATPSSSTSSLCEVETAKAAVELPSPFAGTVGELLVAAGRDDRGRHADHHDRVGRAGGGAGAPAPRRRPDGGAQIGEAGPDGRIATLVGYGPRPARSPRRAARPPPAPRPRPPPPAPLPPPRPPPAADAGRRRAAHRCATPAARGPGRRGGPRAGAAAPAAPRPPARVPLAKPPVRKLAKDLGVDLATVIPARRRRRHHARGRAGARRRGAAGRPAAAAARASGGRAARCRSRASGRPPRRRWCQRVHRAARHGVPRPSTSPRRWSCATGSRATREYADVQLSPLLVRREGRAAWPRGAHPTSTRTGTRRRGDRLKDHVQLGIAAATPRGLIVPNIRTPTRCRCPSSPPPWAS